MVRQSDEFLLLATSAHLLLLLLLHRVCVCVCARVRVCCLRMCSSVWHLYICESEWWVAFLCHLSTIPWSVKSMDQKQRIKSDKYAESIFVHAHTHVHMDLGINTHSLIQRLQLTYLLFCVLTGSVRVLVWAWFNIFPLKCFHGWTAHRQHTHGHTLSHS